MGRGFWTLIIDREYNIKVPQDCGACNIFGSCLLPDGTVMLTDWNNERLKRLDASSSITDHCDMPGPPWGVTFIAPDGVAVTLTFKKMVQFVSVRGSMFRRGVFRTNDNCRGIVSSNGELFVSCGGYSGEGPGHVAVYSFNGTPLRTIKTSPSGEQLFSRPRHITASADGSRIYVADNDDVVLSDKYGNSVSSFTDPSLKYAHGVCTKNNGDVLVCGFNSQNVLRFDGNGRCLGDLEFFGNHADYPTSLSYDSFHRRLIVTMSINDKIRFFCDF